MTFHRPAAFALIALVGMAACPGPAGDTPAVPTAVNPRLVVLVVVDQLPAWAFAQKRPHLTAGFDRLLREGEWRTGRHPTPATLTAPGHALLGTGEPPARSGILANQWWDRSIEQSVKSVDDPAGGISAARLRVPGLGDAIAAAGSDRLRRGAGRLRRGGGARAVSVSLKDRAAILPLGHAGTPIWYDPEAVGFRSTRPLPWLVDHDRAHPIRARLGQPWTPVDPARLARLSGVRDDEPGEVGEKGLGATFPHAATATKDPADAIFAMPLGVDAIFDVATAALDGEQLGKDDVPDLLVLSISPHDFVGHGWGHESWEAWDLMLRLDERLGRFLAALDTAVGADRWALVLTSDHGASPMPERAGGGRITFEAIAASANQAAAAELGPGAWVASAHYPYVYLTAAARAKPANERKAVLDRIVRALRAITGIGQAALVRDFAGDCDRRQDADAAICQMIDPERAGEVFYLPRRGWIFHDADEQIATAHGSTFDYDLEVPVVLVPPGHRAHAPATAPGPRAIPMAEVSTIVSTWLGVTPPRALPRR